MKVWKIIPSVLTLAAIQGQLQSTTAQENSFGGKTAVFYSVSYSPTSQHILIGSAQARKITQGGVGLVHGLNVWSNLKIDYEGSAVPLFLESDPVAAGLIPSGQSAPILFPNPSRVVNVTEYGYWTVPNPNGGYIDVYGESIYGPRQTTYAFAALPVGFRVSGLPRSRIQPTFAIDLGALYATRNVPVDYTSSFNFLACAGPGVDIFLNRKESIRIEYLYEHLSNADIGPSNPGVDSGTYRLTLTHYR
jgi:hypothetical protein